MNPELRANTIRWLAGISGELQRKITRLETENASLRKENRILRKELQTHKAIAKAAKV